MMPNMDGFEFVEELRREPAWRTIPVVVVTAADLSEADRARLTGSVQQVLQKGDDDARTIIGGGAGTGVAWRGPPVVK